MIFVVVVNCGFFGLFVCVEGWDWIGFGLWDIIVVGLVGMCFLNNVVWVLYLDEGWGYCVVFVLDYWLLLLLDDVEVGFFMDGWCYRVVVDVVKDFLCFFGFLEVVIFLLFVLVVKL